MKGIVLLAVIHMLIIYQSQKNKVVSNYSLPETQEYAEEPRATAPKLAAKKDSTNMLNVVRPEYAIFQASRKGPVWNRDLTN